MTIKDINNLLYEWAPKELAWAKDNIGLQVGSYEKPVHKILVALDTTTDVVDECITKNIDLLIVHHPLLFNPVKSINSNERIGQIIFKLIENHISVIALHTNLDFTKFGVNYVLAQRLELKNIKILKPAESQFKKIAVFVPSDYTEKVAESMANAGAGVIGNYDYCSFRTSGIGTFKGGNETKPYIGRPGEFEKVEEVKLEMIVPVWKLKDVTNALRSSHPYEEPAFDVYPLEIETEYYGAGAIGILEETLTQKKFLQHLKEKLNSENIKYVEGSQDKIKTVAVCGGSGSNLIPYAVAAKADAFVTGDVGYHSFIEATGKILLADAGHFETEVLIVESLANFLKTKFIALKENIQISAATQIINPIQNI